MNYFWTNLKPVLFRVCVILTIILLVNSLKSWLNLSANNAMLGVVTPMRNEKVENMKEMFEQRTQKLKEWCYQTSAAKM